MKLNKLLLKKLRLRREEIHRLLHKLKNKERKKPKGENRTIKLLALQDLTVAKCKKLKLLTETKVLKMKKCMKVVLRLSLHPHLHFLPRQDLGI